MKTRSLFTNVIGSFAALLLFSSPAMAGDVIATVNNPDSEALEGVSVELQDSGGSFLDFTTTDENGMVTFTGYNDDTYLVVAKPGESFDCVGCGALEEKSVTLDPGDFDAGTITLERADCYGRVTFQTSDDTPAAGINANAFQNGGNFNYVGGMTDSNGVFEFAIDDDTYTWGVDGYDPDGVFSQAFSPDNQVSCPGANNISLEVQQANSTISLSLVDGNGTAVQLDETGAVFFNCFDLNDPVNFAFADKFGPGAATADVSVVATSAGSEYMCSAWLGDGGAAPVTVEIAEGETKSANIVSFDRECTLNVEFVDDATGEDVTLSTLTGGEGGSVDVFGWAFEEGETPGVSEFEDSTFKSTFDEGVDTSGNSLGMAVVCGREYNVGYWFQQAIGGGGNGEITTLSARTFLIADNGETYLQDFSNYTGTVPEGETSATLEIRLRKADATISATILGADGEPTQGWIHVQELIEDDGSSDGTDDPFGGDNFGFVSGADTGQDGSAASIPVLGGKGTKYLVFGYPFNAFGGGDGTIGDGGGVDEGGEEGELDSNFVLPPAPQEIRIKAGETEEVALRALVADHSVTISVSTVSAEVNGDLLAGGFCFAYSDEGGENFTDLTEESDNNYSGSMALVGGATYDIGCEVFNSDDLFFGLTSYTADGDSGTATIEAEEGGNFYPEQSYSGSATSQLNVTMPDNCSTLSFQANSIDTSGTVSVTIGTAKEYSPGGNTPKSVWDITARDSSGSKVTDFSSKPATLSVCLPDGESDNNVVCSSQDANNNGAWTHNGVLTTDDETGDVTCEFSVTHLSIYGLLRSGTNVNSSSSAPGKPKLRLTNSGKLKVRWKASSDLVDPSSAVYEVSLLRGKKNKLKEFKTGTTKAGKTVFKTKKPKLKNKKKKNNIFARVRLSGSKTLKADYSQTSRKLRLR